jgi:signal transduction histidine kinase
MLRALSRLRWQLTLSHLGASAFTVICLIAMAGLLLAFVISRRPGPGPDPPLFLLAAFGAASFVVLAVSLVFAVVSASVVAYLLSRRLVARLEELGRAAEALRAGDLAARAPVSGSDEVAQLQATFNAMAADLERTLRALQAERDRVTGLLEARRQLVAGVSHELRTPVATIRGYLEAALQRDAAALAPDLRADL